MPTDATRDTAAYTCTTCWFNETPRVPVAGCQCCENNHHDGHFDLDGRPQ